MEDTHNHTAALNSEDNPSSKSQGLGCFQHQSPVQRPLTQQQRERMELNKTMALARQKDRRQSLENQNESQENVSAQQQRERMELNKTMALARQKARRQSLEKQNGSQEKVGAQEGNFHSTALFKEWQEEGDPLWDHSDKTYCHGCSTEEPTISLSKQQVRVLQAIVKGQSVFITGSAGTGKSYLLGFVVKILKKMHGPGSVFVTASTGIAACHLGGMTLHSFAGAIPGDTTKTELMARVKRSRRTVKRWLKAKALVIDEISMIDGEFFDQLNYVANEVRGSTKGGKRMWGGLQLVVTGDFFQLPPVRPQNPNKYFAFEADCWDESFDKQIELRHVFRQSEKDLIDTLQDIRRGLQNPMTLAKLNNCHGPLVTQDGSVVRLFPRNDDVRRENEEKLKELGQEIITFTAVDIGNNEQTTKMLKSGIAPDQIGLSLGAQVMLIKNIETERKLVNGATGEIVEFVSDDDHSRKVSPTGLWPRVKFQCGEDRVIGPESWSIVEGDVELASRTQVPLILAWALSVHKCQGMTLDRVETDLRRAFDFGMVYVALSRVKNLDGLRLIGFNPSKIKAHPKVLDFYHKLTKKKGGCVGDCKNK